MAEHLRQLLYGARWRVLLVLVLLGLSVLELPYPGALLGMAAGLVLAVWLPGWWLLTRAPAEWKLSQPLRLFLAIPISLLVTTMASYLLAIPPVFTLPKAVLLLASVALLTALFARSEPVMPNKAFWREHWLSLLFGGLPFLFFLLRAITNPYLSDMDGHGYVLLLQQVVSFQEDNSFLFPRRAAFTHLVANLHFVSLIDFESLFKWVLPGLFWLSSGSVSVFLVERLRRFRLAALLLLASPAFLAAADRFKPETTVWLAAFPAVIFAAIAAREKSWLAYGLGFFTALTTLRLHDTGFLLVLAYLIFGVVLARADWAAVKEKLTRRNMLLGLVILLPYLLLFDVFSWATFLGGGLRQFVGDIGWNPQWWFLDSYRSAGAELGWPGWRFILYYIYNGGLIFFAALAALVVVALKKGLKQAALAWLPAIAFAMYVTVAEILPRFGVFILPDRAMLHAFFFGALALALLLVSFAGQQKRWWQTAWAQAALALWLACSVGGTMYLVAADGGLVSRSESGVIAAIKRLPANAVVTSTQIYNEILVETYADRRFLPISVDNLPAGKDLPEQVLLAFENIQVRPPALFEVVKTQLIERTTVISPTGWLLQRAEVVVDSREEQRPVRLDPTLVNPDRPVYVLYSFAKTDGLLARTGRDYWATAADLEHREQFAALTGDRVIYRDDSAILFKLR